VNYSYRAIDAEGKIQTGELIAHTRDLGIEDLKKQGLIATEISEVKGGLIAALNKPIFEKRKLSNKELLSVTRELATLISAGLTLVKSLSILSSMNHDKKVKKILQKLIINIKEGESFASALRGKNSIFPKYYISMIEAGEASGKLASILQELSDYLSRSVEVENKIKSALTYPAILMVMVIVSMVIIVTVILPQFEPIFEQAEEKLPWITNAVMKFGKVMNESSGLIAVFLLCLTFGCMVAYKNHNVRGYFHKKILMIPILGSMIIKNEFTRFHRMLGTLISNGLPLVPSFTMAHDGVSNIYIHSGLMSVLGRLKEGSNLSSEYVKMKHIPMLVIELTKVGEDTGKLDEMLLRTSDILDIEVKQLVDRFMTILVPVMTIGMGLIIAGMIAAVLRGIMSMNEIAF
jgi:general secretion pathway protein F